jgi:hypothetical protein
LWYWGSLGACCSRAWRSGGLVEPLGAVVAFCEYHGHRIGRPGAAAAADDDTVRETPAAKP